MLFIYLIQVLLLLSRPSGYELDLGNFNNVKTEIVITMTPVKGVATAMVMVIEPSASPGAIGDLVIAGGTGRGWRVTRPVKGNEGLLHVEGPPGSLLKNFTWESSSKWVPSIKPILPPPDAADAKK